ncbi:MAG TPA: GTPase ObgE [Acidimicrobiales bacterium]|nr:GTPase ObgE [Acidimicrobiales bacterium]
MSGFVDEAQLHVKAGDGGAGAISFRREAHVARGGPDGGDGGSGGDVWLVADRDVASLLGFRDHPHRRAGDGRHGQGKNRHGAAGDDAVVPVPEGTVVKGLEGAVVADLVSAGDRWLAARGGQGGKGNARFLTNRRRAPSFAEQGERGEERWFDLELKLMADAALIGFPNAGKSTLISRISAAKPKIADYPFTTLEPHLGVVRTSDGEMVVADIPGLIEGASAGKGLGHRFLRHVERARVLVVLIDLCPADGVSPHRQQEVLLAELSRYRPELARRPMLVVGSKADVAAFDFDGLLISSVTGQGMAELVSRTLELVRRARAEEPAPEATVVHRPVAGGVRVERSADGGFVVVGRPAERAVAVSDLTNPQALEYVQGRLRRLGVDRALARAGARQGDVVRVGGFSFEYEPD